MAIKYDSVRGRVPVVSVTTAADATPELAARPDCEGWEIRAAPANTGNLYYNLGGAPATTTDPYLEPGDVLRAVTRSERESAVRLLASTGTQVAWIRPSYN